MKIAILLLFFGIAFLLQTVHTEKILVVAFISTKSHKITYMRLIEELASRGHQITIVSPVKATKNISNVREIFTVDIEKLMAHLNIFEMKEKNVATNPLMMLEDFSEACRRTYDLPEIKDLLNEKFDLIFLQPFFNDCSLGLIHKLNAPLVLFTATSVPSFLASKLGGHFPPSFDPHFTLGYPAEMNFYQRFLNFGMTVLTEAILKFYYEPKMTALYRDKLGQDIPTVSEVLANASLILSNGHFSLANPKPYLPDVIDVGGIHSHPAKPLPKDLEDFVTKSGDKGFIYFSMGSAIKGDQMPETKRKMFLKVFSQLPQQVIWKWESETMPDLPKNVKLGKWLPQQDLLGHKNIRMFITHCGGGGTEEAIYHGVPLLGMPMLGDQPMNAKRAKNLGFLVELEWNTLTEEQLLKGINEILNNPVYLDNVKKISNKFNDQVDDPLSRGVYWIEYILRHKGAPHLRSASRKLNFIEYHSIDIVATYVFLIVTFFYLIFLAVQSIVNCICSPKKNKFSSKKKRQ